MTELPAVQAYTDGGCRPNPGPGGWGYVILLPDGRRMEGSGGEGTTTNNRMELQAAIEVFRALESPHRVRIHTDSTYLKNGITKWIHAWRTRGWQTQDKKDVLNRDLWEALDEAMAPHKVAWTWVKGHAGDRWNERADRLATEAMPCPPLPLDDRDAVHLFTAAAYSGKERVGAWAVILTFRDHRKDLQGCEPAGSGNRMHILAAIRGLEALRQKGPVHLYSVSDYLVDGATRWSPAWARRGWKKRDGHPVAHGDLWARLMDLNTQYPVSWHSVRKDQERPPLLEEAKETARQALKPVNPEHPEN